MIFKNFNSKIRFGLRNFNFSLQTQSNRGYGYRTDKLSRSANDDWFERNHPDHTKKRIAHITEWLKDSFPYSNNYEESKQEEQFKGIQLYLFKFYFYSL